MPALLPSQVSVQAASSERRPVLLFELGIGSGVTLFFNNSNSDLIFPSGATRYSAKTIKVDSFTQDPEGQINRININFDNINQDMSAYANKINFWNKPLIIRRIYLGDISDSSYHKEVFNGYMENSSEISRRWFPVSAVVGKPLGDRMLLNQYIRKCRYTFGDVYCNTDNNADLTSPTEGYSTGQVVSGGTNYITLNTTSGATLGKNDNVFLNGVIEMGLSGVSYSRSCVKYTSATSKAEWSVGTPISVDNTYRYRIYRGCNKTWETCSAAYAYGPYNNNTDNFGGFLHIGQVTT